MLGNRARAPGEPWRVLACMGSGNVSLQAATPRGPLRGCKRGAAAQGVAEDCNVWAFLPHGERAAPRPPAGNRGARQRRRLPACVWSFAGASSRPNAGRRDPSRPERLLQRQLLGLN